jgi:hypothetical protein
LLLHNVHLSVEDIHIVFSCLLRQSWPVSSLNMAVEVFLDCIPSFFIILLILSYLLPFNLCSCSFWLLYCRL